MFSILSAILNVPADPIPIMILSEALPSTLLKPKYKADCTAAATLEKKLTLGVFSVRTGCLPIYGAYMMMST